MKGLPLPTPCWSGKTQALWLHPENLQRLVPAWQHSLVWEGCWCPLPVNQGKQRGLGSTQIICRNSCQQSSTRKDAGGCAHFHEKVAGACTLTDLWAPTGEKHKIQDPCQWPCEGSHQWHSFHTKEARGGPLTHILIFRTTESTPTSSKAGGRTTRNIQPAATENLWAAIKERLPHPWDLRERFPEWPSKECWQNSSTCS